MSKINQALSELERQTRSVNQNLQPAQIPAVKSRPVLPWLVGGFTLSMAVGSWSLSYQASSIDSVSNSQPSLEQNVSSVEVPMSPTNRPTLESGRVYTLQSQPEPQPKVVASPSAKSLLATTVQVPVPSPRTHTESTSQNTVLAQNSSEQPARTMAPGNVHIEQVELTPQQLAQTAQQRAQKALDGNNLSEAIDQYQQALRYMPSDEGVRQRLSALYYGKGEIRQAADLLQQGIERNVNSQTLRMALAKLLIKESQQQAALTPLLYLPAGVDEQYLSLRAALAQKNSQDDIAQQSYQKLVQLAPENGRWWMGLGIQQERALEIKKAQQSYHNALKKIGLSSQSQQFVQQRLALLKQLEEQPSAN